MLIKIQYLHKYNNVFTKYTSLCKIQKSATPFSALKLSVRWQEGIQPVKTCSMRFAHGRPSPTLNTAPED